MPVKLANPAFIALLYKPVSRIFKLRPSASIKGIIQDEQKLFLFTCPMGFSEPFALRDLCAPVIKELINGFLETDIESVSIATGINQTVIKEIASVLDAEGYLQGTGFEQLRLNTINSFASLETRKASHAGSVYPSEPEALKTFINKMLSEAPAINGISTPVCLVSPHIDYQRGSKGYAHCYRHLQNYQPDICIVMGTSHKGGQSLFQLSKKHFASPIATIYNDLEFTERLADRYGKERAFADEFLHRDEHSLELQMPFLSVLCPQAKIVPILVNGFYRYLSSGKMQDQEYESFLSALSETYQEFRKDGKKILIIAGVDMAHIGEDFGDPFVIDPLIKKECERRDFQYLQAFQQLSSQGMFNHIASDKDLRKICGFSTLHSIIDLLNRLGSAHKVETDYYEQSVTNNSRCLVSFAAAHITDIKV